MELWDMPLDVGNGLEWTLPYPFFKDMGALAQGNPTHLTPKYKKTSNCALPS